MNDEDEYHDALQELPRIEQTIEKYFDEKCLALIESEEQELPVKLDALQTVLGSISTALSDLISEKTTEFEIQTQINHVLTVIDAIAKNEQKIYGIQSALELISSNRESVDNLIAGTTEEEKIEWAARIVHLESPPVAPRVAINFGLSVLSVINATVRSYAPNKLRDMVDPIAPITFNTESITKLRALAKARLPVLCAAVAASNEVKRQIAARLAAESPSVQRLLCSQTTHKLEEIRTANEGMQQVIREFRLLSTKIIDTHKKLKEAEGLSEHITKFLLVHHGFFVKLSLIFSKICALFKTDAAAKVKEVQAIQRQVQELTKANEVIINSTMDDITNKPGISMELKQPVTTQLRSQLRSRSVDTPEIEIEIEISKNITDAFRCVKTLFNSFNPVEPAQTVEMETAQPLRIVP